MSRPIDHATADRLIPERNEIPLRLVPRSLWLSAALLIAFVALGVYSQSEHETVRRYALLSRWEAGPAANVIIQLIGLTFQVVVAYIPTLSALVMLWISFLSPRWSDRTLWGAAMIFTAFELAGDASFLFPHKEAGEVMRTYPRFSTVVGLIAYGSWLLIIPGSNLSPWISAC